MSQLPTTPLADKIVPARGAAKKAAASFSEQLLSSPADRSDESLSSPFREPLQARARITKTYVGRARLKSFNHAPPSSQHAPSKSSSKSITRRAATKKRGRKRTFTPSEPSDTDQSDLTDPLDALSPIDSASPSPRGMARRHTLPVLSPFQSSVNDKPTWPATPPSASHVRKLLPEAWDLSKLETFVFVSINGNGKVVSDDGVENDGLYDNRMWWPGKISSRSVFTTPLCVTLLGKSSPECDLEIHAPSEHNIQPMLTSNGDLRFNSATYLCTRPGDDMKRPPRKKHKSNIQSAWQAAVDTMLEEFETDNDGLPSVGLAFSETLYGSFSKASESGAANDPKMENRKAERTIPAASPDPMDRWSPPPQDPTLRIPGELILAREPKGTCYWPALLQKYIPPTNSRGKAKFRVRFLDESEFDIPRETFFIPEDDGFASCKLGTWESSYKDVINDDFDDTSLWNKDEEPREPSPMPTIPIPENFCDLTIEEQFVYAKPVLMALLHEMYPPARRRHDDFIKGGTARKLVTDTAFARGTIVPEDVDRLQERLLWWALRDERRAKKMIDVEDDFGGDFVASTVDQNSAGQNSTTTTCDGLPPDTSLLPQSSVVEAPPSSPAKRSKSPQHGDRELSPKPEQVNETDDIARQSNENAALEIDPIKKIKSADDPDHHYPRQQGCEAYEALSAIEKIEYCSNVLLPEAILQILLWRSGERQTLELLDAAEEERLHELGELKMKETDWVQDVMRIRAAKERVQKRKLGMPMGFGGTRSRPKRAAPRR